MRSLRNMRRSRRCQSNTSRIAENPRLRNPLRNNRCEEAHAHMESITTFRLRKDFRDALQCGSFAPFRGPSTQRSCATSSYSRRRRRTNVFSAIWTFWNVFDAFIFKQVTSRIRLLSDAPVFFYYLLVDAKWLTRFRDFCSARKKSTLVNITYFGFLLLWLCF